MSPHTLSSHHGHRVPSVPCPSNPRRCCLCKPTLASSRPCPRPVSTRHAHNIRLPPNPALTSPQKQPGQPSPQLCSAVRLSTRMRLWAIARARRHAGSPVFADRCRVQAPVRACPLDPPRRAPPVALGRIISPYQETSRKAPLAAPARSERGERGARSVRGAHRAAYTRRAERRSARRAERALRAALIACSRCSLPRPPPSWRRTASRESARRAARRR
mmetsp:Transcript_5670/g.14739  ORF Transcript_5670/g.14739 Transcript_5670/m.14739 type:complete len:218 (-) Transcript_5670:493-1146(-)